MLISDSRLELALTKLAHTDGPIADLRASMERAEFKAKATKDAIFLRLEGSVAERQAKAGTDDAYTNAMDQYFDLLRLYEQMKNERAREVIIIDCWRSMNSTRNKGIIT